MEFATQLYRDIVASPLPAPLFYSGLLPIRAGSMQMSPVHVRDVATVFVDCLERGESYGRIFEMGGPRAVSWKEILETIGRATGRWVLGLPLPVWAVKTVARLFEGSNQMPVTADHAACQADIESSTSTPV